MKWRDNIEKDLKPYIERLIKESYNYRKSYNSAGDKGKAQLWVVISILSRQIYNLNLKLDYLEKALQDIAGPKLREVAEKRMKKEEKEIEKFIKEISKGKISKGKKILKKKKVKKKSKKKSNGIKIAKSL